jgi:methylglutaconyl-CoA hydratase
MTQYTTLLTETDPRGIAVITLNRPEVHNAFDDVMIGELTQAFNTCGADSSVRAVVVDAEGKSFCAGADLNWMKRAANYSPEESRRDAMALATMLRTVYECPKPVIARVQGNAFGGGVGLISACDMAFAVHGVLFSLSEVKLGIIPSAISPYVINAIGARQASRYFLTAERFSASEAYRIGLLHDMSTVIEGVDELIAQRIENLLGNGPQSMAEAKALIRTVSNKGVTDAVVNDTVDRISRVRAGAEAKEGMSAFLEKRSAAWAPSV